MRAMFGRAAPKDKGEEAAEQEGKDDEEAFEDATEEPVVLLPAMGEEEDVEDVLQKEEDAVNAQLEQLAKEAAAASQRAADVENKLPDPALAPPAQSRSDWSGDIRTMKAMMDVASKSDEEKIKVLSDALAERIEDIKVLEEHKTVGLRRLDDATKERKRCELETQRALQTKAKLETSCRELQTQKSTIAKENSTIAEEEQTRHTELKTKFETAIKDVQQKMDAELEVRQHFLKENDELRGKLEKFTETYEAQEAQLAEQRQSRESEMEVAKTRLEEHITMCAAAKINSAALEKRNVELRKSQTILRSELQSILGKFDEFHESVSGSNTQHGECKVEIDTLQTKLAGYEEENKDLKENTALKTMTEEHKVAEKQRDALDRLCSNLQKEIKKSQEQVTRLQGSKAK